MLSFFQATLPPHQHPPSHLPPGGRRSDINPSNASHPKGRFDLRNMSDALQCKWSAFFFIILSLHFYHFSFLLSEKSNWMNKISKITNKGAFEVFICYCYNKVLLDFASHILQYAEILHTSHMLPFLLIICNHFLWIDGKDSAFINLNGKSENWSTSAN